VKKGQPLAKLDDTLLLAQIAQAEATLAQQKANAEFNNSNLERAESLASAGATSQQALEQARMAAATTKAAVMAAEASVNSMKVMDDRMTIRAPVTGRILQRTLRPGDISVASTATPYFRIARDGLIELDAELPDARLAQIKEGDRPDQGGRAGDGDAAVRRDVQGQGALHQSARGPGDQSRPRPRGNALRPGAAPRRLRAGDVRRPVQGRAHRHGQRDPL
jgi:RND family efflux transporter MFP subunit